MSLKGLLWSFCHVIYTRAIRRSLFIMDRLLADLETTMGTYELRSYGGKQYDRQGTLACQKFIMEIVQFDIGVEWLIKLIAIC